MSSPGKMPVPPYFQQIPAQPRAGTLDEGNMATPAIGMRRSKTTRSPRGPETARSPQLGGERGLAHSPMAASPAALPFAPVSTSAPSSPHTPNRKASRGSLASAGGEAATNLLRRPHLGSMHSVSAERVPRLRHASAALPYSPYDSPSTRGMMDYLLTSRSAEAPPPAKQLASSALPISLQLSMLPPGPSDGPQLSFSAPSPATDASQRLQNIMLSPPAPTAQAVPTVWGLPPAWPEDAHKKAEVALPSSSAVTTTELFDQSGQLAMFSDLFSLDESTSQRLLEGNRCADEGPFAVAAGPRAAPIGPSWSPALALAPAPGAMPPVPTTSQPKASPASHLPVRGTALPGAWGPPLRATPIEMFDPSQRARQKLAASLHDETIKWYFHALLGLNERRCIRNVLVMRLPYVPVLELQQRAHGLREEAGGQFNVAMDAFSQQLAIYPASILRQPLQGLCDDETFGEGCLGEVLMGTPLLAVVNAAHRLADELNPEPTDVRRSRPLQRA